MTKLNPEQLDAVADALEKIAHILEIDEQNRQANKRQEKRLVISIIGNFLS